MPKYTQQDLLSFTLSQAKKNSGIEQIKIRNLQRNALSPVQRAHGCVVTLHGRGTTGEDLVPIAQEINLPDIRWIFPDAPIPFPGVFDGKMWFGPLSSDAEGIQTSRRLLFDLLEGLIEKDHFPPEKIGLLGFSQGAVMALDVGVRFPRRLGTVIALSGFLAAPEKLNKERSPASDGMPILLAHGEADEVVSVDGSRQAIIALQKEGYSVALHEYPMGHQIISEEMALIREHLKSHLS